MIFKTKQLKLQYYDLQKQVESNKNFAENFLLFEVLFRLVWENHIMVINLASVQKDNKI